jgi:hypothetical protein
MSRRSTSQAKEVPTMKIHMPDPTTPIGALFYALLGAALVSTGAEILHHVHLVWS